MSVPTEKSLKKENEQSFIEKATAIRSRIVSNYDWIQYFNIGIIFEEIIGKCKNWWKK